ncbi:unnamed protein product [Rotaria magnacalcarata]|uniref:MULE transposase domain-containing protein n=2 Tax=Rotaria magnacalcarata TaxID=392030 RepID=A0A819WHP6_9BILA|nr:unnamed protein product [Rotaria magnacalcarata]
MSTSPDSSDNSNTNISFMTSNKGQRLLIMNEHVYRCNKKTARKKYWMCVVSGCSVVVHTDENVTYICGGKYDHNHESNSDLIQKKRLRQQMKQRVLNELTPIGAIHEDEIAKSSLSASGVATFPTHQEIYQTFAQARRKMVPSLPQSCLFTIPDQYTLTSDGKRFLLMDETRVRRERLLVYASDIQLDILFDSQVIYMDGTFSKAPPHFMQIYIIHGIKHDACIPCVFAMTVNKKAITYRQIFSELKHLASERGKHFLPNLIVIDFESGVIPVIKTEFPSSKHYGCYFHYTQCIYKRIQQLGIQQQYFNDEVLRGLCKKLMALALMPQDTVLAGYKEIRTNAESLQDAPMKQLLTYFENNWLSDIDMWNVSTTDSRTNNVCEGYHSRMNHRIHRNHPNMWQFIKFFQAEEKRLQTIVLQWSAGASKKANPRTTFIQNRINTLHDRYDNGAIDSSDLLTGLSMLIGKKKK